MESCWEEPGLKAEVAINRLADKRENTGPTIPDHHAALPVVPGSSSGPGRPAAGPPWPLQLLDVPWPVFQPRSEHASVLAQVPGPCGFVLPVLGRQGRKKEMKGTEMRKH